MLLDGDDRTLGVEHVVRQQAVPPLRYGLLGAVELGELLVRVDLNVVNDQFVLELLHERRSVFLEADASVDHHGSTQDAVCVDELFLFLLGFFLVDVLFVLCFELAEHVLSTVCIIFHFL